MVWRNYYPRRKRRVSRVGSSWDLSRMPRGMGYRLGGTLGPVYRSFPAINAWTGDEGIVIQAELPGFTAEEINIEVKDKSLSISSNREEEVEEIEKNYYRQEIRSGDFSRTISLPYSIAEELVDARLESGILEIKVPRRPEEQPKKISVKSSR